MASKHIISLLNDSIFRDEYDLTQAKEALAWASERKTEAILDIVRLNRQLNESREQKEKLLNGES